MRERQRDREKIAREREREVEREGRERGREREKNVCYKERKIQSFCMLIEKSRERQIEQIKKEKDR